MMVTRDGISFAKRMELSQPPPNKKHKSLVTSVLTKTNDANDQHRVTTGFVNVRTQRNTTIFRFIKEGLGRR